VEDSLVATTLLWIRHSGERRRGADRNVVGVLHDDLAGFR